MSAIASSQLRSRIGSFHLGQAEYSWNWSAP